MFETEHFFKPESSVSGNMNDLWLNIPVMHISQCKVKLPDSIFHFYVQYFPIVFKTRKSMEQHKTGHVGESQRGACCTASSALCFAVTGYFEVDWASWDAEAETTRWPHWFLLGCG